MVTTVRVGGQGNLTFSSPNIQVDEVQAHCGAGSVGRGDQCGKLDWFYRAVL